MTTTAEPSTQRRSRQTTQSRVEVYDVATIVLIGALAAIALFTVTHYAVSNDEGVQHRYGELILAYYTSGFKDRALFAFDNLYLYGGLFDIIAVLLAKILPTEPYLIRHVMCVLTGVGGIAATAATARLIAGPRAGLIAAVLLALCGAWYGGMFNHTKDIPFAAAMAGAVFFLMRASRDLPVPSLRDVIGFGVLLGAALGLRAMGLLLIGYAGIAVLWRVALLDVTGLRARVPFVVRSAWFLAPAFVIGYLIMIAAWPWAAQEPLNPLRAIFAFAHFRYDIYTVLGGTEYLMADVPRYYVPTYLLIKLPLVLIAGAILAVMFAVSRRLNGNVPSPVSRGEIAFVAFIAVFPVLCQVVARGPAFTGLRHFIFIIPALAVLGGIGFDRLLLTLAQWQRSAMVSAATVLVLIFGWNAAQLVRLHPYEYLFYNPLVGGLHGAAGRYATDYWVNIMPEAVKDIGNYLTRDGDINPRLPEQFKVSVCGERLSFENALRREHNPRLHWEKDWRRADFFIAPTHMKCDSYLNGTTVATIVRDGTVIGVVKDRRAITRPDLARRR